MGVLEPLLAVTAQEVGNTVDRLHKIQQQKKVLSGSGIKNK